MLEIRGHFNGETIVLDEPFNLKPNTRVIVKVLTDDEDADEREEWRILSLQSLARAYSDDEPEYGLDSIKKFNPEYEGS